ncbi:myocardial zonula adherens protein isoform X1 [Poecilia formosa]|uniref:Myocardial zonula adherens protein n=2 Tax=Poecilia formosa TaxID=48698 RepID=A0A087XDM2_POEFO|nr:PREDICTED: myocardial zonula adherens protein isoform X1 [Poecilia formosa]
MLRYGSRPRVTTTTTTEDSATPSSERRVLRLTLLAGNDGKKEEKTADTAENHVKETWKKKNGLIHRERPAGMEAPQQHLRDTTNGAPATSAQHHGPKVYGVVQRTSTDRRQELMAREWSVDHLHDEMRYIREVRDSLEKVRERMYGQFGGMQQSMEKLSQEIRAANAHRKTLESEVKVRSAAMENFDQMNTSLISANISLQKSLLENCQNRVDMKDEVKTLRSAKEKTEEKLRDKERELAAAQAENQTLRLQVESSREANTRAVQDLTTKLQREYEEKLQSEQQKHREEIENLQAQLDEYIRRLEEAERNLTTAEAKIAERDERIVEVERLLSCMGMEKSQLQQKLQECEQRIRLLELTDKTDAAAAKKSKQLQEEAVDLRERIKHLNDMVFCQQRKVKAMIEEVESLRAQVAQKDMFISELLDRIAIVECENNELEDKLKYFMSTQNRPQEILERRDVGIGCDLLPRHEVQKHDVESVHLHSTPPSSPTPRVQPSSPVNPSSPTQPLSPTEPPSSPTPWAPSSSRPSYLSSLQYPSFRLTTPIQPHTYSSTNPPPSRLETSLLKYSPGQYSQYLQSSNPAMNGVSSESDPVEGPVPSRRDEVDAEPKADTATQTKAQVTSSTLSSRPRSRLQVSSPFMKLIGHNLKDKH